MNPATITPPPVPPTVSPSAPPAPTPSSGPTPYRWTIRAYRELGKTGLFDGIRTMLINGEILVMAHPNPPHDVSLGLTDDCLRSVFVTGHHVRNQMGFDIGTATDPGPDLAVVAGSRRDYLTTTPTAAALIVEVAETSFFFDTTTKAEWYATAGVTEYWVLDVGNRQLHVFRDPVALPKGLGATAYRTHSTLAPTDTVSPLAAPHATITVADLLP